MGQLKQAEALSSSMDKSNRVARGGIDSLDPRVAEELRNVA